MRFWQSQLSGPLMLPFHLSISLSTISLYDISQSLYYYQRTKDSNIHIKRFNNFKKISILNNALQHNRLFYQFGTSHCQLSVGNCKSIDRDITYHDKLYMISPFTTRWSNIDVCEYLNQFNTHFTQMIGDSKVECLSKQRTIHDFFEKDFIFDIKKTWIQGPITSIKEFYLKTGQLYSEGQQYIKTIHRHIQLNNCNVFRNHVMNILFCFHWIQKPLKYFNSRVSPALCANAHTQLMEERHEIEEPLITHNILKASTYPIPLHSEGIGTITNHLTATKYKTLNNQHHDDNNNNKKERYSNSYKDIIRDTGIHTLTLYQMGEISNMSSDVITPYMDTFHRINVINYIQTHMNILWNITFACLKVVKLVFIILPLIFLISFWSVAQCVSYCLQHQPKHQLSPRVLEHDSFKSETLDITHQSMQYLNLNRFAISFNKIKLYIKNSIYLMERYILDIVWNYVYWAVRQAGPTYIKLIQWMGTRPDIFPTAMCLRCARFHYNVPSHPFPYTLDMIQKTFGKNWNHYLWIDPTPIGTGCVAQVYHGVLRSIEHQVTNDSMNETFQEIAVKVIHPDVRKNMIFDLNLIRFISSTIEKIPLVQWLAIQDNVLEFESLMLSQLDLRTEANNLEKFKMNFENPSSKKRLGRLGTRVLLPTVLKHLSTRDILLESLEDGIILGKWMGLTASEKQTNENNSLLFNTPITEKSKLNQNQSIVAENEYLSEWTSRNYFLKYLEDSNIPSDTIFYSEKDWNQHSFFKHTVPFIIHFMSNVTSSVFHIIEKSLKNYSTTILFNIAKQLHLEEYVQYFKNNSKFEKGYGKREYWPRVGDAGFTLFLQMVLVDNFVHADLHPGNILIRFKKRPESEKKYSKLLLTAEIQSASHNSFLSKIKNKLITLVSSSFRSKTLYVNRNNNVQTSHSLLSKDQLDDKLAERYGYNKINPCSSNECSKDTYINSLKKKDIWDSLYCGNFNDVDYELIILDCGLTTSLSVREFINLVDMLRCLCVGDGYTAGKLIAERSRRKECKNIDEFCSQVDRVIQHYSAENSGSLTLKRLRMGECLGRMLSLSCYYKVELDPRFLSLILAVIVLEGVGRQLNPDIDLLVFALPYLKDIILDAAIGGYTTS